MAVPLNISVQDNSAENSGFSVKTRCGVKKSRALYINSPRLSGFFSRLAGFNQP
ncbi:hypothetical protein EBL_c36270 [Shimwellia blattae DSM 4481 = NBRC 105725]|uniref:Uncharacterized protein n=1 Tax=Shimwellia blattae (strain ATCC 29907 / DSM 4481 / JCM 1650 / NBRC 105725 / CDC 9005-74) TaxID=630626 RepID=I2BDS4_SHIBC|nr:hypothetical protein EBL_c36270 [Shimwellia blattae DSM 4481 = NBRC 105725]